MNFGLGLIFLGVILFIEEIQMRKLKNEVDEIRQLLGKMIKGR